MGKTSKRVRTKQTKKENDKTKATFVAKLKVGVVSGLEYRVFALKAIKQGKKPVNTGRYVIRGGGVVRKKNLTE